MTLYDIIGLSVSNLYRTKLRTILTIMGVIIAIATFVAMLSFGAGNQKIITGTYRELGLFTSMKVYPEDKNDDSDTTQTATLDKEAVRRLASIPGVVLAYPFIDFTVKAAVADTQITSSARAISCDALKTKFYEKLLAGYVFSSDTAGEAIVTHEFMESLGIEYADSLIGKELIISVQTASLDSALLNIIDDKKSKIWDRFKAIDFDSLFYREYRQQVMRRELNEGARRFIDGFLNRQLTISDTVIIIGVGEKSQSFKHNLAPIFIPEKTARRLTAGGFGLGNDPLSLIEAMRKGIIFNEEKAEEALTYPQVTLEIDPYVSYAGIKDSIEALGFRAFSYAEQFKEIQRFFLYYNIALGIIGLIALVTASLGIINTMLMSIIERRKEIGVLRSLGAYKTDIWFIFLSESGAIGLIGGAIGILCGWIGTRIVAVIIKIIMEREGMPVFDPFAIPVWLIILSLSFGLIVSLLAGLYPAALAARVDPVEALRSE
jgi:ABC-type antimicrobial peptide transport system permease subunit